MSKAGFAALLLLFGCSGDAGPAAPASAPPPAQDRLVKEESELLDFSYGWPAQASAIPKLRARLEEDLARQRAEALAFARDDWSERAPDIPFHGHFFHKQWQSFGDGGRLLSLAAGIAVFTGGAHGNSLREALLWDRAAGEAIALAEIFRDPGAAFAAMAPAFCDRLDAQRAEKRGEPVPSQGPEWMVGCRPLADSTVAPVDADDDGRFEIFRVLIEPYEAGAYVEGTYEVDIPITDALRRLVKPAFRGSF